MKRGPTSLVAAVFIDTLLNEKADNIRVSSTSCNSDKWIALIVFYIYISAAVDHLLDFFQVAQASSLEQFHNSWNWN